MTAEYWSMYARGMSLYPDTLPALRILKSRGYKLGLVTDTDGTKNFKRRRISKLGLLKEFDAIVIAGEDTREVKPDPSGYLRGKKTAHANLGSHLCRR